MNLNFSNNKSQIMGILNVTPDSFYDGGKYIKLDNMMFRVDQMITDGLVEEVVELKRRYNTNIRPFNSIGYKEISLYLNSEMSLEQAVELIKIRTRQFAKRQRTWLRKDKEVKWFNQVEDLINFCTNYAFS